ncbi:hypothetical protein [Glaciihabitans sp. UYNi722]|uniref:hypothetical protein n=1 Tax=Glaciihabitans sp. UYNi722 TaxID=3156344 RepID=UPI0033932CFF
MASSTSDLIDDATSTASDALDSARSVAGEAVKSAKDMFDDFDAESSVSRVVDKAGDFIRQQQRDNPAVVLLVVSLLGAIVGATIARATRR